jgi:hypothetical protein
MPCTCPELEKLHAESGCKCEHYRNHFPDCQCEAETVSEHSPGIVSENEVLIRTIYSPVHINTETGEVNPTAFDDAIRLGLSVNRKDHTTRENLSANIAKKIAADIAAGKRKDGFWALVTLRFGDMRELRSDVGARLYCVYDTAKEDDPSHADICWAWDVPKGTPNREGFRKRIRTRLYDVFRTQIRDLDAVY